jgi:hypothetical protein
VVTTNRSPSNRKGGFPCASNAVEKHAKSEVVIAETQQKFVMLFPLGHNQEFLGVRSPGFSRFFKAA